MQFSQRTMGDDVFLKLSSQVETRFVFEVNVSTLDQSHFKAGRLLFSKVNRKVNGKEKPCKSTKLINDNYQLLAGSKQQYIQEPIHYNMSLLYIQEPVNLNTVYSDSFQQFLSIKKIAPNKYRIDLPDGNYNEYAFKNGICSQVWVHHTLYTIEMKLNNPIMKATHVLVTGATGFIGAKLCLALAENGFCVHALCRDLNHQNLPKHQNIIAFKGDILEEETLNAAIKGCEEVYHTAALAKMWTKNSDLFYEVNVIGTQNVLDACLAHQVHKVVYTSTCGVIGPTIKFPMTEEDPRIGGYPIAYERTKYLAELLVNDYVAKGLSIVTVNPSRVFGEGPITDSNTVSKMISGYLKGKWRIIPGNGENIANYVYVDDVVQGHINAMKYGRSGEKYILGGEDICFNEFFETVKELSGNNRRMFNVSQRLIKYFSYLQLAKTRLTGLAPMFLPAFADRLNYDQKYSSAKAIKQLNYQITPFKEGMKKTITYLTNNIR